MPTYEVALDDGRKIHINQAKVNALKLAAAKQGGLPVTPGRSALPTRALIGALGSGQGQ